MNVVERRKTWGDGPREEGRPTIITTRSIRRHRGKRRVRLVMKYRIMLYARVVKRVTKKKEKKC